MAQMCVGFGVGMFSAVAFVKLTRGDRPAANGSFHFAGHFSAGWNRLHIIAMCSLFLRLYQLLSTCFFLLVKLLQKEKKLRHSIIC
jgi:hypothetical protein